MSDAPSVEPSRIEGFYQELAGMQVVLDADPLALGPKRMNAKTAECRSLLSRTERIFLEISQDLYWYRREHRRSLADFELAVQELMSNDPEVRAGRNITDREAVAHTKLSADRKKISVLQFACEDLEAVLTVVKTKRNDLKDVASRLRDQLKICQEEIGLGARWSMRRGLHKAESESKPAISDDVSNLMDEILARDSALPEGSEEDGESEGVPEGVPEVALAELSVPETEPLKLPTSSQSDGDIDTFLDGLPDQSEDPVPVARKIDIDVDDILGTFDV